MSERESDPHWSARRSGPSGVGRIARRLAWIPLLCAAPLAAQATAGQTGSLRGTVRLQGEVVPGVTVTVSSPALQGSRTVQTGTNGDYIVRALPPGEYEVIFALEGAAEESR